MDKQPSGLKQSFSLKMAIVLIVSSVIGSGVFKKVAPMSETLLSPNLVLLAWLLAGIIVLFGVLSISELGAMFPDSGGAFSWLEKAYGKQVAFLYGWSSFTVIQTAAIASVAYVFTGALNTFIKLPHLSANWEQIEWLGIIHPFDNIGAKIITCLLVIALTAVNIRGAKSGGWVSQIFTYIIVFCLLLVVAVSLSSSVGNIDHIKTNSINYPPTTSLLGFIGLMVIAMRSAFWGYEGWLTLGFVGEEIKNPQRNLPKAMLIGILGIIVIYLLANFSYLYVMPVDELIGAIKADENLIAAVVVINMIFGSGGAMLVSAMIMISTFGCTNATILLSSRVYYAMALDGMFFKSVGKTHEKFHTPSNSLILQCIWACVLIFTGSFDLLTDLVIIVAFVFYALTVLAVIILRYKLPDKNRPYKSFGYPFIQVIFIGFCILLTGVSFMESPEKSLIGTGLILTGLPFYFYWKK